MTARAASHGRVTTVVIVSDTHGFVDPRIAALAGDCDFALHAGDIGDAGVVRALRPRRSLVAVRGNNDTPAQWPAEERSVLAALPFEARLQLPGGEIAIVHGDRVLPAAERHRRLRKRYPDVRAIVYGHSHRLVCDRGAHPWVLNPGAAGKARTFGGPSCLLLEARGDDWRLRVLRFPP